MKSTVNFYDFQRAFIDAGRKDSFSYEGMKALFDYLCDFEDGIGQELELDPIAFCCDFTEYDNLSEYLKDYSTDIDDTDFEDDEQGKDEFLQAVREEIENKTTLIKIDDDSFIIQNY